MLGLALLSGRGRLGTFVGALVALIASSALVMAGAMPFEAALRTQPPVERYAGAAAVVTGQQVVGTEDAVVLGERARVDASLAGRLAAVPGVSKAYWGPEIRLGAPTSRYRPASAAVTPSPTSGAAPRSRRTC